MFSMDASGKLIYAKNSDVYLAVVRPAPASSSSSSSTSLDPVPLHQKDLGSIEVYPQSLQHSPNGKFAAVCGDGEYLVYTALAWRSKAFGKALDFVWNTHDSSPASPFAIRESKMSVKIYRNFAEHVAVDLVYEAEKFVPWCVACGQICWALVLLRLGIRYFSASRGYRGRHFGCSMGR